MNKLFVDIFLHDEEYQSKTDENNIVICDETWLTKEELVEIYKKSYRVKKTRYGFQLFHDGKEYYIADHRNITVKKKDEFEEWVKTL